MTTTTIEPSPRQRAFSAVPWLVFAAYCFITIAFLWPLARDPAHQVIPNEDVYGNAWALAWVVHQVTTAPLHLFEANVFFPVPSSLAYTEPLLPQALQGAPVLLLGGSPLLAHNLLLLSSFPLAAFGAYLLARELSGPGPGAFLSGIGYGFCVYRFEHLVHLQSLSMQWLPLALLFARRVALRGRRRDTVLLAVFSLLQALSSGYYAIVLALALVVTVAFCWRPALRAHTLRGLLLGLAIVASLSVVVFLPYRAAMKRESEVRGYAVMRSPEEMIHWSATWGSYLDPGPNAELPLHRRMHALFGRGEALFPTATIALLALVGIARGFRESSVRFLIVLTLAGVLFSLGPRMSLFGVVVHGPLDAIRQLPGVSSLRTPSRFGVLAILGFNLLAAFGWRAVGRVKYGRLLAGLAVCVLLVEVDPGSRRLLFRADPAFPPTVDWLASASRGPVLELPWDHETMSFGGRYIYWSTRHWQQMVNGWGGFYPKGPFELGVLGKLFPSGYSSRELRRAGVKYVVIHLDSLPAPRRARITATTELPEGVTLAGDLGPHRIYEIDPAGRMEGARGIGGVAPGASSR